MGVQIVYGVVFLTLVTTGTATAWVHSHNPFPEGEATVVLGYYCRPDVQGPPQYDCDRMQGVVWIETMQRAVQTWNAVSGFRFHVRSPVPGDDPCRNTPGHIFVIFAHLPINICPAEHGQFIFGYGRLAYGHRWARVYLNSVLFTWQRQDGPYRVLLHELGHAMGLGHPNEVGQDVVALMNGGGEPDDIPTEPQPDDIAGVRHLWGLEYAVLTGNLENPQPGSHQSGLGVISGWVCDADEVIIRVLNLDTGSIAYLDAAYGTQRLDTREVCGDINNGFGVLFNWNVGVEDGPRRVSIHVDGEVLDEVHITVTTLGEEFLRGASGEYTLHGFPRPDTNVTVRWDESLQNFVISGME